MRRHARLKGSTDAICAFCENRLGAYSAFSNVHAIRVLPTQRRRFRTCLPNANQPGEAQGWEDTYSSNLSFQPSLHAIALAKETKQRLDREEEQRAEHARNEDKVRQDQDREARKKSEASEANRLFGGNGASASKATHQHPGRGRKRGPSIRKLTLSFPPRHATEGNGKDAVENTSHSQAASSGTSTTGADAAHGLSAAEQREQALLQLSQRISAERMPSLDYRQYPAPSTSLPSEPWTDDTWGFNEASTPAPNTEIEARVKARLERQSRLEEEKKHKHIPEQLKKQEQSQREDIERKLNQRLRQHGQSYRDQKTGQSAAPSSSDAASSIAHLSQSLRQGLNSASAADGSSKVATETAAASEVTTGNEQALRQQLQASRKFDTSKQRDHTRNSMEDTLLIDPAEVQPFDTAVTSGWSILNKSKDKKSTLENNGKGSRQDDSSKSLAFQDRDQLESQTLFSPGVPLAKRTENRVCRFCGEAGHIAMQCPKKRSQHTAKPLNKAPAFQRGDAFRSSKASPYTSGQSARGPKDALSDFAAAVEAQEKSDKGAMRSRGGREPWVTTSSAKDPASTDAKARIGNSTPQTEPTESEEILFSGRSRKFTALEDLERPDVQSNRRQRDVAETSTEDHGGRRRGNKRAQSADVDDFQENTRRDQRGRRRERDDDFDDLDDLSGLRKIRERRQKDRNEKKQRAQAQVQRKAAIASKRSEALAKIVLPQFITVSRLAQALGVKLDRFTRKMESLGFSDLAYDHVLSAENASLIALEFNFDPTIGTELEVAERDLKPRPVPEDQSAFPTRPPIVTIMGHVDHGKTTILDYLRKSSVAASEHGGITQHIGAFSVRMSGGKLVTFLDTPGHAAFLSMRKRGANVTDIVILVVAADDSVKPQTLEALKHAREAKVPIIVAVNKVDKPEADVQRVKNDLARHGVEIEDFGGDVQVVPVSGKTGQGMDDLEEAVVTLGEILDHRADDAGAVEGWVLEATTRASGRVATVLVRNGTLKQGSIIVAGQTWTRVRSLQNEAGISITSAGPGTPVEVDGWRDQPTAGDLVLEAETEQRATDVVDYRVELAQRQKLAEDVDAINEARRLEQEKRDREKAEAEARANEGASSLKSAAEDTESKADRKEVAFIIKADVSGSAEAVENYLQQLVNPVCSPRILRSGVGPVSEFDVEHASAAGGHIVTFNLPGPAGDISSLAEHNKVKILEQNVIYRLLEQVKSILEDTLEPTMIQRVVGEAIVLKPFDIGVGGRKKLRIAGSRVRNGQIKRSSRVRVLRNGVKVYDGTLSSLKNLKKDVTEMRKGAECGIGFEEWTDAQEGDQIQTYEEISEKRTLPI